MKKTLLVLGFIALSAIGIIYLGSTISTNASTEGVTLSLTPDENGNYTLEEMLTAALLDEYIALSTYEQIIEVYGEMRPFTRIIEAEKQHIELLLPLFETYGIELPNSDVYEFVIIPESITEALATGVNAEIANIALYEAFLSQEDLPEDVSTVFEYLQNASENHLRAFSRDRMVGAGYEFAYKMRNQFGRGNQNKGQGYRH
jgi:hypothetical protein